MIPQAAKYNSKNESAIKLINSENCASNAVDKN
jgi:glycine/serine hydroxymethyltransferase